MDRTEVASVLAVLAAAFPHVNVTKETAAVYAEMLADVGYEEGKRAAKMAIATSDYFPSVATLRRFARRPDQDPPAAMAAWHEVRVAFQQASNEWPKFSHPAVEQAARAIGWWEMKHSDNASALRAHFCRAYDEAVQAMAMEETKALVDGADRKALT
jgi:hypothetical protein